MICLPTRGRGRQTRMSKGCTTSRWVSSPSSFWKSNLDSISMSGPRGWCYLLENEGLIGKDEFDKMETLIGDWRKSGQLPLDFCADDEKRGRPSQP